MPLRMISARKFCENFIGILIIARKLRPSFNAIKSAIGRGRKRKAPYLQLPGVPIANRVNERDVAEIKIKTGESRVISYLRIIK